MKQKHKISNEILKACDIRGIVGSQLDTQDAYFVGKAFGSILIRKAEKSCIVGYDGRLSSLELSQKLIQGLQESGINVIDVGLVPTPVVYFAIHHLKADAGIIVTASHNPSEYNGFKFQLKDRPFHGDDIQEMGELCAAGCFSSGSGRYNKADIKDAYVEYLIGFLDVPESCDLSVVWDPGHGASAAVLSAFLKRLPGKHYAICNEVDGTFPCHHPDPSLEENLEHLKQAVLENEADLGIAFDGDGDRLGIIDGKGKMLLGDQLLVLFARDLLKRRPASKIMSEVKASRFFTDDVISHGGEAVIWKVGHTNQKEKMRFENIPLAGETSGHMFFEENRGLDDGMFASVKLLNILMAHPLKLSEIREAFPRYHDSGEIRIPLETAKRKALIEEITLRMIHDKRSFLDIDGIRTETADGFWMIRASNTQPHMTIRCEAASEEGLRDCMADLDRQLELSGIPLTKKIRYSH
ncbi:MAG: phosphomannomutase/phosphoglucomutase [Spirochaetaceae bacterium 4572_59]|nr:MAG: phosphomannomutase/phosphoglucomutase [Spirochaetaceae bacterium 4572_59]